MGHTGQAGYRYVTQVQVQVQHRRRYSEAQRKTARGVAAQPCIRGERSGAVSASTCYVRTVRVLRRATPAAGGEVAR
jgi:hypothetical protein